MADFGRQIAPDAPRLDGHVPSLPSAVATSSSSASTLSLVCVVGRSLRGPRFVTCRGRSSVRPNRHSTRAQDSGHVDRSIETSRNRLPLSGCAASTTSTSAEATSSLALGVSFNPRAGGDRLAQPAAHVATTERRIGFKNVLRCGRKDASNRPFCDSIMAMGDGLESLPDDIEMLKAALIVARAEVAAARARQSDDQALIAHLKLQIEKLNRDRYGPRSERTARLLDQLELTLEELESSATEDELAAEMAAAQTTKVASFTRKRPSRQPFPEHLPRERVICRDRQMRLLWWFAAVEARRGHHRDAGGGPEIVEGVPEVQHVREEGACCCSLSIAPRSWGNSE